VRATELHPLYAADAVGVNHSYDGYFHLRNSQLEELLCQLPTVQQPAQSHKRHNRMKPARGVDTKEMTQFQKIQIKLKKKETYTDTKEIF